MKNILVVVATLFLASCSSTQHDKGLGYQGQKKSDSGQLKSIETLESLRSDPDVTFRIERDWTVASKNTDKEKAVWSFPPETHEAYPSVVKRAVEQKNGKIGLITSVSCGATKEICDRLVQEFIQLNQKVKNEIHTN